MPIDTSSYYPEVNAPEGSESKVEESLNGRHSNLFGEKKPEDGEQHSSQEPKKETRPETKLPEMKFFKFIDTLSAVLSWVLVPLLMPVYGIIFIFRLSVLDVVPAGLQTAFTFIIAGINFAAPMLLIYLLKRMGVVQDLGLNGRKERLFPYAITFICYGISAWFLAGRGAPIWVSMFFVGGGVASFINLLINLRWKISAHSAAIAGIIALLVRLEKDVAVEPELFLWLLITVGAAGLLGSARVWMNRHTVWQVIAGYAVGFCSVFFLMAIH